MRLETGRGTPTGFLPPAYRFLQRAPSTARSGKASRPALGIYNVSLERATQAMESAYSRLVEQIDVGRIPKGKEGLEWMYPATDAWSELLHAMDAHVDDVRLILAFAIGGGSPWKTPVGRCFTQRTVEYADQVSRIVNHIKHSHGRVRPFAFYTPSTCYPGYYVEGAHESGALGPEPTVHKRGRGAFSFARDSRLHFVWLYLISQALADSLRSIGVQASATPSRLADATKYVRIAGLIQHVPYLVYPDESTRPVPRVELTGSGDLILSYSDDASAKAIPRAMTLKIATTWHGDGTSSAFVVPYEYTDGPDNSFVLIRNS